MAIAVTQTNGNALLTRTPGTRSCAGILFPLLDCRPNCGRAEESRGQTTRKTVVSPDR